MARMPYVDLATAPEQVRGTFAQLPVALNIFRMMAHAESNFRPLLRLGSTILAKQKLSARLRELAILRVAQLSAARYEWVQHVPIATAVGVTRAQIDALEDGAVDAECFAADDQLVLRFTTEVVREVRASDLVFEAMRKRFAPQEIVELILAVGFYMMMARLMETTGVDLEADVGTSVIDALK
jgi:alkylhydroperoxidase family enzyme